MGVNVRRPEPVLLLHDALDLVERLVLVLVFGNDGLAVLVPLFRHGVPIQARGKRRTPSPTSEQQGSRYYKPKGARPVEPGATDE
jgi:hypothetical protein